MTEPELAISIEFASDDTSLPTAKLISLWIRNALDGQFASASLDIRVVDGLEMQAMNRRFRQVDRPTNVLSFPADIAPEVGLNHLGDLLICAPVLAAEALDQGKLLHHHWAHMVTHGVLHLLGFDHLEEQQAQCMEQRERDLLGRLGIADPYE